MILSRTADQRVIRYLRQIRGGGAPCNVLAMLARLGYRTAFIGKVGDDYFGRMLGETIEKAGIGAEGLLYDPNVNTTLALVHTLADGDRDFSFYRKPGADIMLTENEVNRKLIEESRIFHFNFQPGFVPYPAA